MALQVLHSIGIWEYFKKKLKKQYSPTDIEVACGLLHRLKQMGSIRDLKNISLFFVRDQCMIDKNSLFYSMDGLKDYTCVALDRQGALDLEVAITEAESIIDCSSQL